MPFGLGLSLLNTHYLQHLGLTLVSFFSPYAISLFFLLSHRAAYRFR